MCLSGRNCSDDLTFHASMLSPVQVLLSQIQLALCLLKRKRGRQDTQDNQAGQSIVQPLRTILPFDAIANIQALSTGLHGLLYGLAWIIFTNE